MSCLIAYTYVSVIVIRFIVCELLLTEGDRPSNQKKKIVILPAQTKHSICYGNFVNANCVP